MAKYVITDRIDSEDQVQFETQKDGDLRIKVVYTVDSSAKRGKKETMFATVQRSDVPGLIKWLERHYG